MKPVVGIAVVKNEDDVIEAMVRHNLTRLDHLHIIDNGSADRTPDILGAMVDEGLPCTWSVVHDIDHRQDEILTQALPGLAAAHDPARVLLLDADEFIKAESAAFRDEMTGSEDALSLPWQTYVPTPGDMADVNVLRSITHRRVVEPRRVHKVSVPGRFLRDAVVRKGNHQIHVAGALVGAALSSTTALAHMPIRSGDQLKAKVLIGSWSVRLRNGNEKRREAFHWHRLAGRFRRGEDISPRKLSRIARKYATNQDCEIVADPIPSDIVLRYTEPPGEGLLLRKLAHFAEALVQQRIEEANAQEA